MFENVRHQYDIETLGPDPVRNIFGCSVEHFGY